MTAPAAAVYRLIAEVENWPRIFPPTVYVDHVERRRAARADPDLGHRQRRGQELDLAAACWTPRGCGSSSARRSPRHRWRPWAAPGSIEPVSQGECRVRLLHDYRAVDDDPEAPRLDRAGGGPQQPVRAGRAQGSVGAGHRPADDLMLSFEDTVRIDGAAKDVYDFINEAQLWKERLPHVVRVALTEDDPRPADPGDGHPDQGRLDAHHQVGTRVLPAPQIVYKQITLPALMTLHTGYWLLADAGDGVAATSQHTVVINAANIRSHPRRGGRRRRGPGVRQERAQHQQPGDARARQGIRRGPASDDGPPHTGHHRRRRAGRPDAGR